MIDRQTQGSMPHAHWPFEVSSQTCPWCSIPPMPAVDEPLVANPERARRGAQLARAQLRPTTQPPEEAT